MKARIVAPSMPADRALPHRRTDLGDGLRRHRGGDRDARHLIRTFDGRRVVVPNATLFSQSVTVDTAYEKRRLQYDVGIGYGDDIGRARGIMLVALRGADGVLTDPAPDVLLVDLAGSSVNLRARWWIAQVRRADLMGSRDRVLQALKEALLGAGIDLPYPTRQVLFHDQTGTTDGDRACQREGWPRLRPAPFIRGKFGGPVRLLPTCGAVSPD